jgi:ethanolamine utilization microcompartment shell protein EutS
MQMSNTLPTEQRAALQKQVNAAFNAVGPGGEITKGGGTEEGAQQRGVFGIKDTDQAQEALHTTNQADIAKGAKGAFAQTLTLGGSLSESATALKSALDAFVNAVNQNSGNSAQTVASPGDGGVH